jgi:hypothetical protein
MRFFHLHLDISSASNILDAPKRLFAMKSEEIVIFISRPNGKIEGRIGQAIGVSTSAPEDRAE